MHKDFKLKGKEREPPRWLRGGSLFLRKHDAGFWTWSKVARCRAVPDDPLSFAPDTGQFNHALSQREPAARPTLA